MYFRVFFLNWISEKSKKKKKKNPKYEGINNNKTYFTRFTKTN